MTTPRAEETPSTAARSRSHVPNNDGPPPLVVGLGSPDRGDDAIGPTVARRVAALGLPVRVVEHEDPTALIELWQDVELAVVVDAVWTGRVEQPGALLVLESGADAGPLQESAWARTGRGGTHAFGLAAAVELSRALGRLPRRVVLVGVSAHRVDYGAPLSEPVAVAVEPAVAEVVRVLREAGAARPGWRPAQSARDEVPPKESARDEAAAESALTEPWPAQPDPGASAVRGERARRSG